MLLPVDLEAGVKMSPKLCLSTRGNRSLPGLKITQDFTCLCGWFLHKHPEARVKQQRE